MAEHSLNLVERQSELQPQPVRSPFLLLAVICFVVAGGVIFMATTDKSNMASADYAGLVLALLLGFMVLIPLFEIRRSGRLDLFQPLLWLWVFQIGPLFVLKGIDLILFDVTNSSSGYGNVPEFRTLALLGAFIGVSTLFIGYYVPLGKRLAKKLPKVSVRPTTSIRTAVVALFLSWVANGAMFQLFNQGRYGYTASIDEYPAALQILIRLTDWRFMGLFVIFWLWTKYRSRSIGLGLILLAALIPQIGIDLLGGGRGRLFATVLFPLVAYVYAKAGSLRFRSVAVGLLVAFGALIGGVIFFTEFRAVRNQFADLTTSLSVAETTDLFQETSSRLSSPDRDLLSEASNNVLTRLTTLDVMSTIFARADSLRDVERQVGMDNNILKELTIGWIPRILWPDKPVTGDLGLWIYRVYYGGTTLSWSAITSIGDLYRNFGWIGIVIGMFMVGVCFRMLYDWLILRNVFSWEMVLLYFLLLRTLSFEAGFTEFITNGARIFVAWLAFVWIMRRFSGTVQLSEAQPLSLRGVPVLQKRSE